MTGIAALLGGADNGPVNAPLSLGTVTSVGSTTVQVLIDGAETGVTATKGTAAASVDDRVIVAAIGRALYVIVNLNA